MILKLDNLMLHIEPLPLSEEKLSFMQKWIDQSLDQFSTIRLKQFLAGRYCAMLACKKIGIDLTTLPIGDDRLPCWPLGICGSISHSKDYAIAVVSDSHKSLGIDIERIIDIKRWQKLNEKIINNDEKILADANKINPTIIFSAKESLYKLLYPMVKKFFGFHDASVLAIENETFTIELKSKKSELLSFNRIYQGNFWYNDGNIITLLSLK